MVYVSYDPYSDIVNGLYEDKTWEDVNFCWQNATIKEIECHNECKNEFNNSVTCHPKLEDLLSTWHNLTQYNETWLQFIISQYDLYFQSTVSKNVQKSTMLREATVIFASRYIFWNFFNISKG